MEEQCRSKGNIRKKSSLSNLSPPSNANVHLFCRVHEILDTWVMALCSVLSSVKTTALLPTLFLTWFYRGTGKFSHVNLHKYLYMESSIFCLHFSVFSLKHFMSLTDNNNIQCNQFSDWQFPFFFPVEFRSFWNTIILLQYYKVNFDT